MIKTKRTILIMMLICVFAVMCACGKNTDDPEDGNAAVTGTQQDDVRDPDTGKDAEPTQAPESEPTESIPVIEPEADPEPTGEDADDAGTDSFIDALGNDPSVYDYDLSEYRSVIRNMTWYDDHYVVTVDVYTPYTLDAGTVSGAHVGDTLELEEGPVTVVSILSQDENYEFTVENDSWSLGSRVIVAPVNLTDFYTPEQIGEDGLDEYPERAGFGFVQDYEGGNFTAYADWEWEECYVTFDRMLLWGVNLVVTDETAAHPMYYNWDKYDPGFSISGTDYLNLLQDDVEQQNQEIYVYDGVGETIILERDAAGNATGAIEEFWEIYMP